MPFSCSNKPQKRPCKQIQQQERGELSLTKNGTHKIGPHCQKQTQRWPISRRFLPLSKHKHVMPCYSCRPKSCTRQKPVGNKVSQTSFHYEVLIATSDRPINTSQSISRPTKTIMSPSVMLKFLQRKVLYVHSSIVGTCHKRKNVLNFNDTTVYVVL